MDAFKIVAVSAGLSVPSATRLLTDQLVKAAQATAAEAGHSSEARVVELRDLATDIANNMVAGYPSPALAEALEAVASADGLIAVTPIFSGSYSGLFKSFFDVMDNTALTGKPVLIAATGGTPRHSLALEHALRPLFSYLRAVVVPTAVYAASQDWGASGDSNGASNGDAERGDLSARITQAGGQLADFIMCRPPGVRRPADGFVPFEQQLAALDQQE